MMTSSSKVSILMNCSNGAKYLKESIDSVISQTYENWELVFYDNCSTDDTKSIVLGYHDFRIKYYYSDKFLSLGKARKSAEKYLDGDFIGILDSDDIWMPDKLALQIEYFSDQDLGLIFSASTYFNEIKEINIFPFKNHLKKNFYLTLLDRYNIPLETVLIRSSFLHKLPYMFDDEFDSITDFDLLIRISKICKTLYLPIIQAKWRYHKNSDTNKLPLNFVNEKEKWVDKMDINHSTIIEKKLLLKLKKNNSCEKSRIILLYSNRKNSLFNHFKNFYLNLNWLFTLLLILTPYSKYFLRKRYSKGLEL